MTLLLIFLMPLYFSNQSIAQEKTKQFKDTVSCFLLESKVFDIGKVPARNRNQTFQFKYIGDSSVYIRQALTSDPHFICKYPNTPLVKGEVYEFNVCYYLQSRVGKFTKMMGFELSNGERIFFKFIGECYIEVTNPNLEETNQN